MVRIARITLCDKTDDTIEVILDGLDESYSRGDRVIVWNIYEGQSFDDLIGSTEPQYILPRVSSSEMFVWGGLSPGSWYSIKCFVDVPYDDLYTFSFVFKTDDPPTPPTPSRPDQWVWSSGISAGSSVSLDSAGIHPVSATEWNNFTARINEFRQYAGYSAYSFVPVSRGDDFKTAYNHAVAAIKGVSGYGTHLSNLTSSTVAVSSSIFQLSFLTLIASEANAIAGYT